MTALSPTTKPPSEEKVLLNVPIVMSTSFSRPKWLAGPASALSDHAGGVRIVDEDPRIVPVRALPRGRGGPRSSRSC